MMNSRRRQFLHLAAGVVALPATSQLARAQAYPLRPVRIIVGAPAGGGIDITARLVGQWLSERFGQQFVIENRPGAGGNIAAETFVHAPADGHTLFLATPANAINATLYERLGFDFGRDIAPVGALISVPLVIVVHPSLATRTVPEFIAYARANPGKVNMGLGGTGGVDHVAGALFRIKTGADVTFVPYRGLAAGCAARGRRRGGQPVGATMKPNTGARYEIAIDGKPRSYRDLKPIAIEAAELAA